MPFDPAREAEPVQFAWHPHVAEHEVNRWGPMEGRDRASGITGLKDMIAGITQRFSQEHADHGLVLNHKDRGGRRRGVATVRVGDGFAHALYLAGKWRATARAIGKLCVTSILC